MIPQCEPGFQRQREAQAAPVVELHSTHTETPARPGAVVPMPRWSRRDLVRIAAVVAAYAVERAAARVRGET